MGHVCDTTSLGPEARRALQLVAQGLGAGAIAERLGGDRDAVQRHLAVAIVGLDARSVPDAVRIASRRGLIRPSVPPT